MPLLEADSFGDTAQKLLNIAVFTPLTIYTLRGQRPPDVLILAGLVALVVDFTRDVGSLMRGPGLAPEALAGTPPEALYGPTAPLANNRAHGPGHPGSLAPSMRRLYAYRVNRSGPLR